METNKNPRDIEIAKLAFIGSSIAAIGDGISALAAALALDALQQNFRTPNQIRPATDTGATLRQLDYFINELIHIRNNRKD